MLFDLGSQAAQFLSRYRHAYTPQRPELATPVRNPSPPTPSPPVRRLPADGTASIGLMMVSKERFSRLAGGLKVDEGLYLEEPLRVEVIERWHQQGLSRGVTDDNYRSHFDIDRHEYVYLRLGPGRGALRSEQDFTRLE